MTNHDVKRQDDSQAGRWMIDLGSGVMAEMTYRRVAPQTIAIEHTYTPPEFRGQGVADALMGKAIADSRADGLKIVPICSYVVAQFRRHPEWADLLGA